MAVKVLTDTEKNYQCLYCSTTMVVFGPIFYSDEEDAEEFLEWLRVDARSLSDAELANKKYEWVRQKEQTEDI